MHGRLCDKSGCLYNLSLGGEGNLGHIHSEEIKAKIRAARARQVFSDDYRQALSLGHMGIIPTEETRLKLREAQKRK